MEKRKVYGKTFTFFNYSVPYGTESKIQHPTKKISGRAPQIRARLTAY